jgi:hypothetical protein
MLALANTTLAQWAQIIIVSKNKIRFIFLKFDG